jgi:hypothetical protein
MMARCPACDFSAPNPRSAEWHRAHRDAHLALDRMVTFAEQDAFVAPSERAS